MAAFHTLSSRHMTSHDYEFCMGYQRLCGYKIELSF